VQLIAQLVGAREAQQGFAALSKNLQGRILRRIVPTALAPVLGATLETAPRVSGRLWAAVGIRELKRQRSRVGYSVAIGERDFTGTAFYAAFLELGTAKLPARHWMRLAFQTHETVVLTMFSRLLKRELELEAAKIAKRVAQAAKKAARAAAAGGGWGGGA